MTDRLECTSIGCFHPTCMAKKRAVREADISHLRSTILRSLSTYEKTDARTILAALDRLCELARIP